MDAGYGAQTRIHIGKKAGGKGPAIRFVWSWVVGNNYEGGKHIAIKAFDKRPFDEGFSAKIRKGFVAPAHAAGTPTCQDS
jgi:hypothetical protein